ncbi:MAG TPA: hypothetical protein VJ673_01175 [Aromatoleum sp.]|uniref:TlpA family protein disulfide reductase n=1 Tax=Aromatoleum sp. TaxID=2307007 RepID=UPI002B4A2C8E|nr:hypothetical protein [Aromatoleum sp.]HJV24258.1 hypothetical protein [Aromatoleum sp.]
MKRLRLLLATLLCVSAAASAAEHFVPLDRTTAARVVDAAHYSKPTIVALWSSDCVHCKKNLKLFAEMAKANPQLKLITVATEPVQEGLAAPLDRFAVPGERFAYGSDMPEALAFALDEKWRGELPRTLFFDGRGGKVALSGVIPEATVRSSLGLATR